MKVTQADVRLWQYYKLPRFAGSLLKGSRPSIHEAINARVGVVPRGKLADYSNTFYLLRLARKNYESSYRHSLPGDPPNFRAYVARLAVNGDTPGRRAYCSRVTRRWAKAVPQ